MHGFAVIKYVVVRTHGLKIQMGSDLCYPARKIRLRFGAGGFFSFRQKRRDLNKEGESRRLSEENSPGDCFRRRGQRAQRGDRRNAPEKSLRAGQKIDKFRLVDFFIHCESNGISSTIAVLSLYLISPLGLYIITRSVYQITFAMMIYKTSF